MINWFKTNIDARGVMILTLFTAWLFCNYQMFQGTLLIVVNLLDYGFCGLLFTLERAPINSIRFKCSMLCWPVLCLMKQWRKKFFK